MSPIKFRSISQRLCSPLLSMQNSPLLLPERCQHTHPFAAKVFSIFRVYEDVVGLTEVKAAQTKVLEAEQKFVTTQEQRREKQQRILQLQNQLKEIHAELDKTHRGEDRYLTLITQEHAVIKEERSLLEQFKNLEKAERDYFASLSLALRESHEKERAQGERTKYWSIIGSVCGAVIGIIGATINNRIRLNQLRDLVERSSSQPEVQRLVYSLSDEFKRHRDQIVEFVSDIRELLGAAPIVAATDRAASAAIMLWPIQDLELQMREVVVLVKQQQQLLERETKEIKALLAADRALEEAEGDVRRAAVYIGEDVRDIVADSQRQLEWKMKINSLAMVALVYGALAVTVPLLAAFFKGS
ncbi:mitochondrial potassium channel [Dermacentor silvarum]|uniref:mitochondrial potassium channel n=1 Tax=Dermacentor silvarum TaxID=543639 RepID=UPI00189AF389|nr:mitochondrial potassium channel [Dermacentor silvarum]